MVDLAVVDAYLDPEGRLWVRARWRGVPIRLASVTVARSGSILLMDPLGAQPDPGGYSIPGGWVEKVRVWTLPVPSYYLQEGIATLYGGEASLSVEAERFLQ